MAFSPVNGISNMFHETWKENGLQQMLEDFRIDESVIAGCDIVHAYYHDDYSNYCGKAYVLFVKDGKYYEVFGSHCSCMGLEDQWEPEEVTLEFLLKGQASTYDRGDYHEDLQTYLANR